MTVAQPVDAVVNPNNPAQRYILWGNGRIDNIGGAPAITDGPSWFDNPDQPVAVALHITNWATGQGYVLDAPGGFQPLNGAPDPISVIDEPPYRVNAWGAPYFLSRRFGPGCWSWNPDGSNSGYVVDLWGQIYPFGGATPPPRTGPRFGTPAVRGWAMYWSGSTRKGYMLDASGAVWADFSASVPNPNPMYFPGRDVYRSLAMLDANAGSGYALDSAGTTWPFGGAPQPGAYGPYRPGADVARVLTTVSPADPIRMWQVWSGGQSFEYVQSTPPTVTAGGTDRKSPANPTTTTTRPVLSWSYSDPQRDSQGEWQLFVFTESFAAGRSMTDPVVWASQALVEEAGQGSTTRAVTCPVDLPNGGYRLFVRVRDSAGQWSSWSSWSWAQNVPVPATPTGITATPSTDPARFETALSVSTGSGSAGSLVRFECSDDGGATWAPVRGADALPRASTTRGVDYDAPLGRTRVYRAVTYSVDPRTASDPSVTVSARLDRHTYVLTSTADPGLGGEVHAVDPSEWTRTAEAGVFQGIGAKFPTVVSDGEPKARRLTLHINTQDRGQWETVEALAESDSTLVYRDAFGEVVYCRLVGDWSRRQIAAAALPSEKTPLRHMHATPLPLVEVAPPVGG